VHRPREVLGRPSASPPWFRKRLRSRFGDILLGPGDFHLSPKGSSHPPVYSAGGCLCLIVMPIE
jgi:hypothetical protein